MNQKGFIALVSILVISAVALTVSVSIALLGVGEASSSLSFKKGQESLKVAESCIEEALIRLRDNASYDPAGASTTLPDLAGSCTIDVSGTGVNRTIDVTSTISAGPDYTKKIQVTAKRAGNSINITGWAEVE